MAINPHVKTYTQKPSDIDRRWVLIDASSAPLGRVAGIIANYLTGKYKPTFTPSVDAGDNVVVINAKNVKVTGNKETAKIYYRHSGFPGGIKDAQLKEVREKYPERIIENAVAGMIPKNKLSSERMKRLRVFAGSDHTHTAQTPEVIEVK